MSSRVPPDQAQRIAALDPSRSILVQAPAGSGKTDLLTRRFLRLLAEVDDPGQILAITFTRAAAAEMRHRILAELEKASANPAPSPDQDAFSMAALGRRALEHSQALGWQLLDLPAQLRISTIDSFCRELALQQPLVTGMGGELEPVEQTTELYRRAARRTLEHIDGADPEFTAAIEALLLWRDNNWQEMEALLMRMLGQRDRWMRAFVLERGNDWNAVRAQLERPFANAVRGGITPIIALLANIPDACNEMLALAQFACKQPECGRYRNLAERAEFPAPPFADACGLEDTRLALLDLADLLLTGNNEFRNSITKSEGFPAKTAQKAQLQGLISRLRHIDGLAPSLAAVRNLPPARYSEEDWNIVSSSFLVLRHAAGELRTVFAETGNVDFIEVAQIALRVLRGEDGLPTEATLAAADKIHHLLIDEFQDTNRRQYDLVRLLIATWSDAEGRTCFVVGDPMQSIYAFRDADPELFLRLRNYGVELPDGALFPLDFVPLTANFRTDPQLVEHTNEMFVEVFGAEAGSQIQHSPSIAFRDPAPLSHPRFALHASFMPRIKPGAAADPELLRERETIHDRQIDDIVSLIREKQHLIKEAHKARASGVDARYRVAVLGRTHKDLARIAQSLRQAHIPFRAVELEHLQDRPEVRDAISLGRALLNPEDRVAWLGVLRAPWCGLALDDLHKLVSADDEILMRRAIPGLLAERSALLSENGRAAVRRLLRLLDSLQDLRAGLPTAAFGTWLQQVWTQLGGLACEDAAAQANLDVLWSCLDALPDGAQDMLGPALGAALESLTALPDPAASSDCGVQLMTIHKAKGLEFEIVIVPELQARSGRDSLRLLAWLERGLPERNDANDITEFLVAPMQSKGTERSGTRRWVDRVSFEREKQERCRILYVAATRAREELHFFALPEYKKDGQDVILLESWGTLLATAWPALRAQLQAQFEAWRTTRSGAAAKQELVLEEIAASEGSNLLAMPARPKATPLRRLPSDFAPSPGVDFRRGRRAALAADPGDDQPYQRHEGGLASRALGNAVHRFMEQLARLRTTLDWPQARAALRKLQPAVAAQIRASGIARAKAEAMAVQAFEWAMKASEDPQGQWILSPHPGSESEASWSGVSHGELRTVRADRIFRAGLEPLGDGADTWWIIDYKTAAVEAQGLFSVSSLRDLFAPQLESYAAILRALHGSECQIRAGLYYPRVPALDWWELKN